MEKFSCKTMVIAGAGATEALKDMQIRRMFLVSDPYFEKNGTAEQIGKRAGAEQVEIFGEVEPDPTVELAARGTARLQAFGPDWVVALGGGSAMDAAKAMVYFSKVPCRLAVIPTTSGSGSEVTDFAVLTHRGGKYPLTDPALQPDAAILDSDLLRSLPKSLIADAGFDILTHAVEAFTGKNASPFSDCLAAEAFRTAFALLPASFAGNQEVRLKIHRASTMAGLAFTHAGLGLCHAMAHSLGGMFHVPHGRLNAILLPAVISSNARGCPHRYGELARAAGFSGSADAVGLRNLKNGLIRLRRDLELPQTLMQAGVAPGEVWNRTGQIVEAVLADPCCRTNPMPVEDFMVRRILEEVTGRV